MNAAAQPRRFEWSQVERWSAPEFAQVLGPIVEHAPWVAHDVERQRPFATLSDLHGAMVAVIRSAPAQRILDLLNGHPELAGREAEAGTMTDASNNEQARLGLLSLDAHTHAQLQRGNAAYRQRHGFPYIVALKLHRDLNSVMADLQSRLENETLVEMNTALAQVAEVMRGRLEKLFGDMH